MTPRDAYLANAITWIERSADLMRGRGTPEPEIARHLARAFAVLERTLREDA